MPDQFPAINSFNMLHGTCLVRVCWGLFACARVQNTLRLISQGEAHGVEKYGDAVRMLVLIDINEQELD